MAAKQTWLGRFALSSDAVTIDFDDNGGTTDTLTLTTGFYFLDGYTSESTDQLIEHINTEIQDLDSAFHDVTFSYDYTTNKVSVVAAGVDDIDITFTDTDLRDLLGFTANISNQSDTATTATNYPYYTWMPDRGFSGTPVDTDRVLAPRSGTHVHVSRDGTVVTTQASTLYAGYVEYSLIDGDLVIIPNSGAVSGEFERFFVDVIAAGEQIRLFPDNTATSSSDYLTVVVGEADSEVGSFEDFASRHVASYNGLFDLQIPLVKYV